MSENIPDSLDGVYAPIITAIPPVDAGHQLSLLADGRIRHYNGGSQAVDFDGNSGNCYKPTDQTMYIESLDGGLHWQKHRVPEGKRYGITYNPITKKYYAFLTFGDGLHLIESDADGNYKRTPIMPLINEHKPVIMLDSGKRMLGLFSIFNFGSRTLVSDDFGKTWQSSNVLSVPEHKAGGIHKGIRWNHNATEPTAFMQNDGTLRMIMRTSLDKFWQSFSKDGGITWSKPEESPFYGTGVMPTIGKLKDGSVLFLFCNATPLPELAGADGYWEDVFTNRNILHAAISRDDGKTWEGFRELYADPRRNAADFATVAGGDKSAHQTQFVEPANGKIVAAIGQHRLERVIAVFDTKWLLEKSRVCDFSNGLDDWSVFNYKKGIVGHCGYNRIVGCSLVPNPDDPSKKCLEIKYRKDTSLVSDVRGGLWNFPALRKGVFKTKIRAQKAGGSVGLNLLDRWFNPTDTTAEQFAMFSTPLKFADTLPHEVLISWDIDAPSPEAVLEIDGKKTAVLPLKNATEHGISYVHFISDFDETNEGVLIERVEANQKQ